MSRLFALVVLVILVGGGFYAWKLRGDGDVLGAQAREKLGAVGDELQDAKVTASVKTALSLNRTLQPLPLEVDTEAGVVTLRGEVPDEATRAKAEQVAAAVPGVRQVVNHLRAGGGAAPAAEGSSRTLGESLDDQKLEVQVRLAWSLNKKMEGTDVEVRSFRRELTLTGEVGSPAQKELAVALARETPSVAAVADQIRVRGGNGSAGATPPAGGERAQAVEKALGSNPNLAAYGLRVQDEGGRLVLRGRVKSGAERDLAALLARDAAGGPVDNAVEIEGR